jgi:hypothetical protein
LAGVPDSGSDEQVPNKWLQAGQSKAKEIERFGSTVERVRTDKSTAAQISYASNIA